MSVVPFLDVGGGAVTATVALLDGVHCGLAVMPGGLLRLHCACPSGHGVGASFGICRGSGGRPVGERIERGLPAGLGGFADAERGGHSRPRGTTGGTQTAHPMGFGAGGSVTLDEDAAGAGKGTYAWGGAAGTPFWVDRAHHARGTVMVNYMPADKWPVRDETVKALLADYAFWKQARQ